LSGHDNILKLVDAQYVKDGSSLNMMILSELCEQGTLFDLLQKYNGKLSEDQIIFIMKEISK
jgi:serine/threonine protein kinase